MPDVTIPDTPQTRAETYLAAANGQEVALPTPMTREEIYLNEIATKMQGGGSGVTVEPLSVTANGEYTAPSGKAFNPVTVAVPAPTPSILTYSGFYQCGVFVEDASGTTNLMDYATNVKGWTVA